MNPVAYKGNGIIQIMSQPEFENLAANVLEYMASLNNGVGVITSNVVYNVNANVGVAISPAVNGKTFWNFHVDGDLILTNANDYTITPSGTANVAAYLWGGGGGGSYQGTGGTAGGSGFVGGNVKLDSANTFTILVAGGGKHPLNLGISAGGSPGTMYGAGGASTNGATGGYGGGGGGGSAGAEKSAGGGGGASGLFLGTTKNNANAILVAAGGAGGSFISTAGVGGGGLTGGYGGNAADGGPGTQVGGGAAGAGGSGADAGGAGFGGGGADSTGEGGGSGGGSGYYGGGGGGNNSATPGDLGGGGSSYYNNTYVSGGITYSGTSVTPGNDASTKHPGIAGYGAAGAGLSGANGAVVISILDAPATGNTLSVPANSILIGSFDDIILENDVGTPGANIISQTLVLYQELSGTAIPESTPPSMVTYDSSYGVDSLKVVSVGEYETLAANILSYCVTNDGPFSYVLANTAPASGTWEIKGALTELANSTLTGNVVYLYQKIANDSYTYNKPLKINGSSLQKFTDQEVRNIAKKVRERILATNIGEYRFQENVPTEGTWVAKGSLVDVTYSTIGGEYNGAIVEESYDSVNFSDSVSDTVNYSGNYLGTASYLYGKNFYAVPGFLGPSPGATYIGPAGTFTGPPGVSYFIPNYSGFGSSTNVDGAAYTGNYEELESITVNYMGTFVGLYEGTFGATVVGTTTAAVKTFYLWRRIA